MIDYKVTASTLGAAITLIVLSFLNSAYHVITNPTLSGAVTVVVTSLIVFAAGWSTRSQTRTVPVVTTMQPAAPPKAL
jgi:uncharacterized protein YacL